MTNEWGFLRETEEKAAKAGKDKDTGVTRTGLEKYLNVIFPEVNDWVHDKMVPNLRDSNGEVLRFRPDYRSEDLKMIIEFDGLPHYTQPDTILKDEEKQKDYENIGYKVIRIPYFIQLTNEVVKLLFGVDVKEELFDENIPSMGPEGKNTPAYLCHMGVERMAKEFTKFPQQYKVNMEYLKEQPRQELIGYELLEKECNKIHLKNMRDSSDEEKVEQVKKCIEDSIDIINLEIPEEYFYSCLPLCLIDAIYSINVNYFSTRNVVENYCVHENIEKIRNPKTTFPPQQEAHNINSLIATIGETDKDIKNFEDNIVYNHNLTSTKGGVSKAKAVLECAKVLRDAGIQTICDFNSITSQEDKTTKEIEENFKNVKGQSSGLSLSYLKMLCGDENKLKPDRHILRFLSRALGYDVETQEAEIIIQEVVNKLKEVNPDLTIRALDYAIWNKMRSEG